MESKQERERGGDRKLVIHKINSERKNDFLKKERTKEKYKK